MTDNLPDSIFDKIVNLYKEAVRRLPAIKYSWGLVAIICILALINFFKLGDTEVVFRSSLLALGIIFLIFIFSFLTRTNDKAIKYGMYILTYAIILTTAALVIGFAIHTLTPLKIPFYENILAAHSDATATDTAKNINRQDTASVPNDTSGENNSINPDPAKKPVIPVNQPITKKDSFKNVGKDSQDHPGFRPDIIVPQNLCTVRCKTRGLAGVEVSFEDPVTHKLYRKVSGKDQYLEFQVPCALAKMVAEITFSKDGRSDYRNQKISDMQIPGTFN